MKKNLLLLIFSFFTIGKINSQIIFTENFETSSPNIPPGWHQQQPINFPTNLGWKVGTTIGGTLAPYVPAHTHYAFVNDLDNNSSQGFNKDTLYTPVIDLSSYSSVFISFDYWYYGGFYSNPGDYEIGSIAASGDGGITWTTIDTLGCWESDPWRTGLFDLSAYAGNPNVMIAFTYDDLANDANGVGIDNVTIYSPINYDVGVTTTNMFYLCKTNNSYPIKGTLHNYGGTTITSIHLKYKVNNGPVVSDFINSVSVPALTNYNFTHNINWVPSAHGDYIIKMWADTLNGPNADQLHANDTLTAYFVVIDTIQNKMPVLEEFTQASCDPCMYAIPNLDSVLYNNRTNTNALRYHVSYPGRDFINVYTDANAVAPRVTYYGIQGVPDARIDGTTDVYPGFVSSSDIQTARSKGSPFSITVNSSYNPGTHQYTVTANITAHGDLPAGLKARCVLTVDTIKYHNDQSDEDPQSSFAPPIGSGTTPDSYYPYVLDFPEPVERMMPNSNGISLAAFVNGQTQVVNYSWTKNRAWADSSTVWTYDSTTTHITVFVQNDGNLQAGWGALPKYIYQSATDMVTTGIENILTDQNFFELYPNPAKDNFDLVFKLEAEQSINVTILNMLGEKVCSLEKGRISAGLNKINVETENLLPGIYFVNLITENGVHAKKVIITK